MTTIAAMSAEASIGTTDFIARHGLWTPQQHEAAERVVECSATENLRSIRVGCADAHGKLRGKTILAGTFPSVLRNGVDFSTALFHFDSSDAIVYNAFEAGAGLNDSALNGFPDIVLVPDPLTFKVLPWVARTGWCLGNLYYGDGRPVPFDGRAMLKTQLDRLEAEHGLRYLVGLEVEFYITRLVDHSFQVGELGGPGEPPSAPAVTALAPGYAYQSEDHQDQIEDILAELADNLMAVGLPLRTMEDEWGPGQCEFTFHPLVGLEAADAMLLFRAATKQICRRMGLHATFMCRPGLESFFASGWHLHQSLIDADGVNAFATEADSGELLTPLGRHFVGGLLEHAVAASVLTTPTINGYRRRKPYSLAPDRSTWGVDNRAAMLRIQGGPGDPATHVENRVGEPAANPYFYLASQVVAGLDGLARQLDPGEPEVEPYAATHRPLLPNTLWEAVEALRNDTTYHQALTPKVIDWLLGLKDSEVARFTKAGESWDPEVVSDWEHREYFAQY